MKINYEELYQLLYAMNNSKSINDLSNKLYCSVSKASKMIKEYEENLNVKIYDKNSEYILNTNGQELLKNIEKPLVEIQKQIYKSSKKMGVDENLIEDSIHVSKYEYHNIIYNSTHELIEKYKKGELDAILISSDFEVDIIYNNKEFICTKPVYSIQNRITKADALYANDNACPITRRLELNNQTIDFHLKQSVAICKIVRKGSGRGYTFSVDTLDEQNILIEKDEKMKIKYFLYYR